jgi:hypothetical protein
MAQLLSLPVLTNIREFRPNVRRLQSPEVDGLVQDASRRLLIEVKSYGLAQDDVNEIVSKYGRIRRDEMYLVAPTFQANITFPNNVYPVRFLPDLSAIRHAYLESTYSLPKELGDELACGDHHFRYVSACRRKGETTSFRNQVDKRMKNVSQVLRDIRRQNRPCDLPVRVFWSVSRWLFPKELFFSSYPNQLVKRGLVFDIDGSVIHNVSTPCKLLPRATTCTICLNAAKQATKQLLGFLAARGLSKLHVVFSGRQGFHVYALEPNLRESEVQNLVEAVQDAGIPIDAGLARDRKAVVTLPGSVHGFTMLRAIPVVDLEGFTVDGARDRQMTMPVVSEDR